jgi:hypothetical protein
MHLALWKRAGLAGLLALSLAGASLAASAPEPAAARWDRTAGMNDIDTRRPAPSAGAPATTGFRGSDGMNNLEYRRQRTNAIELHDLPPPDGVATAGFRGSTGMNDIDT